ncbi:hypothetical protein GOBAR_AA16076 [Gossypium barbadense]|uniref:Clp R domain-containing protein n=1 Tax=Gossypium barbadense TaxID=3634 RepID=A0A2P5XMK0_GOSBA|nr:hypothetical protein GOBAR_AA16076 [Gossypium barbadense]
MRSGACTVQQTLTAEAASILKHSLSLARRRGHAQVTPLHVAATLLSTRASLLRRACLKSQQPQLSSSHPLQCRALELCFNVALNRLPTTPGPILHGQPSLSNALVAALKRAQAHQRRGCIEQQQSQQPILTIKVELEQLIISILDDPSVSRVMREAGFSSTVVKANIEDSSSSPSSVFQCYNTTSGSGGVFSSPCSPSQTHFLSYEQNPFFFSPSKKLLTSYIPDSASLKQDIKLVFEVLLRKNKRRNSVIVGDCVSTTESLVSELTSRVEKGDVPDEMKHVRFLKFYFSPMSLKFMKREDVEKHVCDLKRRVDSIVAEGGAIIYTGDLKWTVVEEGEINGYNAADHLVTELGRLISDYYMSNKVWLVATASYQTYLRCQMRQPPLEVQWALQAVSVPTGGLSLSLHASSCHDTKMVFSEMEKKQFEHERLTCCAECSSNYEKDVQSFKSSGGLPPWMHVHGRNNSDSPNGRKSSTSGLNRSLSISFIDSKPNSVPRFRRQNSCTIELNFGNVSPNLDSLKNTEDKEVKVTLALGSDSPRKSTGLCELLQGNLPWQSEIISSIAEALMGSKKETWLLIEGTDMIGKRRLARVVAEYVLGSPDLLLYMDMKHNNETTRCNERLKRAFSRDEKLVVMVENVDLADTQCLKLLADRFEGGDDGGSSRSIIILTKSISSSFEEHYAKKDNIVIEMKLNINGSDTNKRKHEWGGSNKTKTPRTKPSSHILDLNMKAADDDEEEEANESGEVSDLTADLHVGFLELIQKRYFLNQTEGQHKEMKEAFMAKFKRVVEEIFGGENKAYRMLKKMEGEGV